MDFWSLMIKKDDMIISSMEFIRNLKYMLNFRLHRIDKKMRCRPIEGDKDDLYILLNGPSLASQDLSILKGRNTMFVNRGFKHPLYAELKPQYHVFIDTKMLNGIWPVSWLDEIWSISPKTTIVLPLSWALNPLFTKYIDDKRVFWYKYNLPFYNLGVSGCCFDFAFSQKYKTIYFSGFDATGIGHEMVKSADSHFYGNDKELENKPTTQFVIDLLMHSRHLHDLNRLADYCKKHDYHLVNITNGGLLDMFPRQNILPLLK